MNGACCFKPNAWVGIDPGMSKTEPGAAALIHTDGYEYFDWSSEKKTASNLRHWSSKYNIKMVAIERQWARQTDTKAALFGIARLIENYGFWKGVCYLLCDENSIVFPTPNEWQKSTLNIFLKDNKLIKKYYMEEARKKFPDAQLKRQKHNGRAAALWIATYSRRVDKINGSRIN